MIKIMYLDSKPNLEFSLLQGNIWGQIVNQQPLHWTFFNNFVIEISVIAKLYAIFHHYLSIVLVGGPLANNKNICRLPPPIFGQKNFFCIKKYRKLLSTPNKLQNIFSLYNLLRRNIPLRRNPPSKKCNF